MMPTAQKSLFEQSQGHFFHCGLRSLVGQSPVHGIFELPPPKPGTVAVIHPVCFLTKVLHVWT